MTTLKQGDLIKNRNGKNCKVLGVCGEVVHVSFSINQGSHDEACTEADLKEDGYTWDTPAWEPEIGSIYWHVYINGKGEVEDSVWSNDKIDIARRDFLGIYETEALAKAALLEIRRKLGK